MLAPLYHFPGLIGVEMLVLRRGKPEFHRRNEQQT